MSGSWAGAVQLQLLALASFAALTSGALSLLMRPIRRGLAGARPEARARAWLWIAAAPLLGAVIGAALCALPTLTAAIFNSSDHCLLHGGHHHLCLVHRGAWQGGALAWLLIGALAAVLLAELAALGWAVFCATREIRALRRIAQFDAALGAHIVDSETPLGFAAGLWSVEVFVSSSLLAKAPRALLDVLLAHERAHVRRRDSLKLTLARALCVLHLPRARRRISRELEQATEQACDEDAAAVVGDRVAVAESLVRASKLLQRSSLYSSALVRSFGPSMLEVRVKALLDDPPSDARQRGQRWRTAVALALLLALGLASPLHHAVESALAPLLR